MTTRNHANICDLKGQLLGVKTIPAKDGKAARTLVQLLIFELKYGEDSGRVIDLWDIPGTDKLTVGSDYEIKCSVSPSGRDLNYRPVEDIPVLKPLKG